MRIVIDSFVCRSELTSLQRAFAQTIEYNRVHRNNSRYVYHSLVSVLTVAINLIIIIIETRKLGRHTGAEIQLTVMALLCQIVI